jgi:hypothetical protein
VSGAANLSTGPVTHSTSGVLAGTNAIVVGSAARTRLHETSGVLAGQAGSITGSARHNIPHTTSGELAGQTALITGTATRTRTHDCSGALDGQTATLSGEATQTRVHEVTGALVSNGAVVAGDAALSFDATPIAFDEATINAIAAAVWATQLPLGSLPRFTYGTQTLSATELEVLSHAIWSKSLP